VYKSELLCGLVTKDCEKYRTLRENLSVLLLSSYQYLHSFGVSKV
jgi:hypothetical protein